MTKNKLMELITGTKTNERKIIFLDEGKDPDTKVYDPGTTIIRFVNFRERNEKLMKKQEIRAGH
jgi:hypothetical protein